MQHPEIFYKKKVKVTVSLNFLLVVLAHTQIWLGIVNEFQPIIVQISNYRIEYHVHSISVHAATTSVKIYHRFP